MKKKKQPVHSNAKIPLQITAILVPQHKSRILFAKWSLGNVM